MSEESTKFVRLQEKIKWLKTGHVHSSSSKPIEGALVLRGEVLSSTPPDSAREDGNILVLEIIEPSNTDVEDVAMHVHAGVSIPGFVSGRQHIGYKTLLKYKRKEFHELKYDFSEISHGMEGHDVMEASLM